MLVPARIGSARIDISSLVLLLSFGFLGYTTGITVLVFTLAFHIYKKVGDVYLWLGLIPYVFPTIASYYLRKVMVSPKRKLSQRLIFVSGGLLNSIDYFFVLLFNADVRADILTAIITLFVGFPLIGYLNGLVMFNQRIKLHAFEELGKSEALLRASINAPRDMEIFVLDLDYNYLSYNDFHAKNLKRFFNGNAKVGNNFLNEISNHKVRARLENSLARVAAGETFNLEIALESVPGKHLHDF